MKKTHRSCYSYSGASISQTANNGAEKVDHAGWHIDEILAIRLLQILTPLMWITTRGYMLPAAVGILPTM